MESRLAMPPELLEFLSCLSTATNPVRFEVEPGGEKAGNWWIDIAGPESITVEWRPGRGFGVWFGSDTGYGEGPSELFRTAKRAADRVQQILTMGSDAPRQGLRVIRELYKVSQEEIAERLNVRQAAISRLEGRTDPKVETISNYVAALGGHVEFRVIFPDGQMPIYWSPPQPLSSPHAKTKSRRRART